MEYIYLYSKSSRRQLAMSKAGEVRGYALALERKDDSSGGRGGGVEEEEKKDRKKQFVLAFLQVFH